MSEINYNTILDFISSNDFTECSMSARRHMTYRAREYYADKNCISVLSRFEKDAVDAAVESMFRNRMMETFRWISPIRDLQSGETACCSIEGDTVKARISFSPKEMTVHLVSPECEPVSTCLHPLSNLTYTLSPFETESLGDDGIERIEELIAKCYFEIKSL